MISIRNGKLRISDGTRTVLDTDDKMLHILGEVNGVTPYYGYTGGNNATFDLNDRIALGTVPAACTQVIGAVKMDLAVNLPSGLQFDRWHMVMGGTVVWLMDGEPGFAASGGSNFGLTQYVGYHFSVSGGVVYLNRRAVLDSTPRTYIVISHRIFYRLKAGAWT